MPFSFSRTASLLLLPLVCSLGYAHEHEDDHQDPRVVAEWTHWARVGRELTPAQLIAQAGALPEATTELTFADCFAAPGSRGLTYSDKLLALAGKQVRLIGFMVKQDEWTPGHYLLTRFPIAISEHEYGHCDDLPAATFHVVLADPTQMPALQAGPLAVTGTLELGLREMPDGRNSYLRLVLSPENKAVARAVTTPASLR